METAAALTYTELVLGGYLTPMQMVEKMSYNPAQILHLKKGTLEEGRMADVMLLIRNALMPLIRTSSGRKQRIHHSTAEK